ncbi:unnamed protein product [Ophioblennius macclurei]
MKIRVRINKQTSRVELEGAEPSVNDLSDVIRETLLETYGLSSQTNFTLSLNGSEFLNDGEQTLASCGIVSGDLVNVVLPQSATPLPPPPAAPTAAPPTAHPSSSSSIISEQQRQQQLPSCSSSSGVDLLMEAEDSSSAGPSAPPVSVWEPMLCSEAESGRAPLSLERLYHTIESPSDALMVAAHLLMLETGFVPQVGELRPDEMPTGWKLPGGVYKLQYLHPLCEGSVVTAGAVCMGPLLVINMTLKAAEKVDTVRKLCLKTCSYVNNEWSGGSAAAAFKDLRRLSRVFKDQLAYPLIAAARDAMALPVAFGLAALPPELLFRVLRLLDVRSVVRLSSVSCHFNAATADSTLWKHLYYRDFGARGSACSTDTDWKSMYMNSYRMKRESRRQSLRYFTPHVLPGDVGFIPALPGIIGGEYDNRPNFPHPMMPRPRYDPIGPFADPDRRPRRDARRPGPPGGRPFDIRRGFI